MSLMSMAEEMWVWHILAFSEWN